MAINFTILIGHHSVSNQKAFKIDLLRFGLHVVEIDFICEVGNVLSSIGLTSQPEDIRWKFRIFGEEV